MRGPPTHSYIIANLGIMLLPGNPIKCYSNFTGCQSSLTIERNADMLLNACKDIGLAVNTGKTKYMEI